MLVYGLLVADTISIIKTKQIVVRHRFHRFLSLDKLTKPEARFKLRVVFYVLFGRLLIGPRVQIFLVAGILKIRLLKFLLTDAVSALAAISIMIGIGYAGGNSMVSFRKDMTRIEYWDIVIVLAAITIYLLYAHVKARRQETNTS